MTTSEQAALLAEHQPYTWNCEIEDCRCKEHLAKCRGCGDIYPCDVHRMAELKDAETAQSASEVVERIVEALEEAREDSFSRESLTSLDFWNRGQTKGFDDAIALLRSRDWSKGEGE
jgi:hypothetical protein